MAQYHTNSPYHKLKDEQYGGDFLEKEKRHYRGIQNLDKFLCQIYGYFLDKGYKNIILSRLLNILTAMWVVALVIFLTSCVDYDILFKGYQFKASLSFQGFHPILTISLVISGVSFLWKLKEFVSDAIDYWEIRTFYLYELKIDDAELATIEWREVAKKLTEIPNLFRTKENLSVLDIANRIMRKENYMIALINRDILKLGIPLPFLSKKKFLTKTIEWGLSLAVLSYVFDYSTNEIDPKIKNPTKHKEMVEGLRKRCFYLGLLFLLVSPFMFVFVLTYFIFQHGEEIRSKPAAFAARQWSPLARWKFRELNELPHIFMKRLQQSYSLAEKYVNSFPDTTLATIAKFISFIVGSVVVILLAFGVVDDDFLTVEIFEDKSALWVIGVGGAIVAVCRALIPDENAVFEPEKTMEEIVQHTHYFPKSWRGKLHTLVVLGEFAQLFEYKVVLFIAEVISVLFGPFILMFSLPGSADKIIQFFRQYTVHVDSVGDVCKFAVFPLDEHGNKDFGVDSDSRDPTKEGKLEKSFLNFKANYPDWKPSRDGERYLMNLDRYISSSSNQTVPIMSSMMLDNNNMASPMESIMERNRSDLQQSLASLNHIHRQFFRAGSIPTANNNMYP